MDSCAQRLTVVLDAELRPEDAAAELREAGATRAVVAVRDRPVSSGYLAALRRAGAEPFGIEPVALDGRGPEEAQHLLDAARAKLDALAPDERGRPRLNGGALSRRALFTPGGAVTYAPVAVVDERACAGTAYCGLCVERCPERAIARTSPAPTVDPGACSACGLCVPACPSGALRLAGSATAQSEAQLSALVGKVEGVVLACRDGHASAPSGWALVELPTLALVTAGWALQLRAHGLAVRAVPCDDERCAAVAGALALADRVPAESAQEPLCLTEPRATAAIAGRAGGTDVIESDASPLGVVSFDATGCTLCGACATACPTAALCLEEDSEETALRLRPGTCVACGRCTAACPERVLGVRRGIDLGGLRRESLELAWAPAETCDSCGATLPPRPMRRRLGLPDDVCAPCAARAAQDY